MMKRLCGNSGIASKKFFMVAAVRLLSNRSTSKLNLSDLSVGQVSRMFTNLDIKVNKSLLINENFDGELISLLETNDELKEIGITIPSLKFKKLMKNITKFKSEGVSAQWLSQGIVEPDIPIPPPNNPPEYDEKHKIIPISAITNESTLPLPNKVIKEERFFPIRVKEVEDIMDAFEVLLGNHHYSEECLVKALQDIQKLLANSEINIATVGGAHGCDSIMHYLLHGVVTPPPPAVVSTSVMVECLNVISLLCRHSDRRDATNEDNIESFEHNGAIEAVTNILLNPDFLKNSAVVRAACQTLRRLAYNEVPQFADAHSIDALLNVLYVHQDDPTVLSNAFSAIVNLATVDINNIHTLYEHGFANTLYTHLLANLDDPEVVVEIMWCLRNFSVDSTDILKQVRDSKVFSLLSNSVFRKYKTNQEIMLLFCHIVSNCCHTDMANKVVLSDLEVCERLIEIYDMYDKLGDDQVVECCLYAMSDISTDNHNEHTDKLHKYVEMLSSGHDTAATSA